jgi:folylpolyglutamate synthase
MNGKLVSKEVFGLAYWTVRVRLEEAAKSDTDNNTDTGDVPTMPGYFRMLTLMALHIFCTSQSPRIDVILLEAGMGGRYDATNVVEPIVPRKGHTRHGRLLVRGVTVLDYDHVRILGSKLEQIAWEKGGIYIRDKSLFIGSDDGGYDAFTATAAVVDDSNEEKRQPPEGEENDVVFANGNNSLHVLKVLNRIAVENGSCLDIIIAEDDSKFDDIGLKGAQKKDNAALALAMCQYAAEKCRLELSHDGSGVLSALAESFWPGRWHTVPLPVPTQSGHNDSKESRVTLRCDGAHTPISMEACTRWFREVTTTNDEDGSPLIVKRVLVFNCSHERNPIPLLYSLCKSDMFDSVFFCHADCERPSAVPKELEDGWTREHLPLDDVSGGMVTITFEEMIESLSKLKNSGPTKSSETTWQATLGYLWSVMEAYHRRDGDGSLRPVTIGLSVKEALASIQDEDSEHRIEVCVTGSLYIVGSALAAAGWEE